MTGKRITVIDDEPAMVEMLSAFLRMKGFDVQGAYSAREGLAVMERTRPAALLLDLMMPEVDGIQFCQQLRAHPDFHDLPIIIVSARNDVRSKAEAEAAGATLYLTKPVRFPELIAALSDVLGEG